MNSPNEPQSTTNQQDLFPAALDQLSIRSVDALAVFRSYADTLGLVDFINQLIPTALDVSAGHVVPAYGIEDRVLHVDTTSNVMYGDYEFAETAPPPLRTRKRSASSGTR